MCGSRPLEREEQELPAPSDAHDATTDRAVHVTDPPGGVGVPCARDDRAPDHERRELTSDGFDLGQLWHAWRLLVAASLSSGAARA